MLAIVAGAAAANACSGEPPEVTPDEPVRSSGDVYTLRDTTITAVFEAAGTAAPLRESTLATKLMGTVTAVLVREGDAVAAGQPLLRLDDRELAARASQVAASMDAATSMHEDALVQARRIRALFSDSVATRAQLDAVETALARAEAGLAAARAASAELDAMSTYAIIRAPFAGVVIRRFVDPGAFAAPGSPLLTVQDASQLRIVVAVTPEIARGIRREQALDGLIEQEPVHAVVEGVVPSGSGNLYHVNAIVRNPRRALLAGSAATLSIPTGERVALVVPANAIVHEGDLAGVIVRGQHGDERRWVRLGHTAAGFVEVIAGLKSGDRIVVPATNAATTMPGR
jgi:RND family efflux transporter MFP subunit